MKKSQLAAIAQLETALAALKKSGLVMVGIDSGLYVSNRDDALLDEIRRASSCEAILQRSNTGHSGTETIDHRGVYLDSGGA